MKIPSYIKMVIPEEKQLALCFTAAVQY